MKRVLVTGSAGFIGFHTCRHLLAMGLKVFGCDNLNNFYSTKLKQDRLDILLEHKNFSFKKLDLNDSKELNNFISKAQPEIVYHLAAQAGVRYSFESPEEYIVSNINGTFNLIEALKKREIKHLLFSSTSSVYGNNIDFPFSENIKTDSPASLYSATKKSCENLLYYYSYQFKIPTTVMRFFTVYGPWGRPDQALYKFVENIFNGQEIEIFNEGNMERDFTYIDDLVDCFLQIMKLPPKKNNNLVNDPNYLYRVVNIGSNEKVNLNDFVEHIENKTKIKAQKKYLPHQPGDIYRTQSDNTLLFKIIGERDFKSCAEGVQNFVEWYKKYNKI